MSESENNNPESKQDLEAESAEPEQEQENEASSDAAEGVDKSNSDETAEPGAAEETGASADSNAAEGGEVETNEAEKIEEDSPEDDAPAEPVHIPDLSQIIEGAILAADKPLSIDHIIQLFPDGEPSRAHVREAIEEIQAHCEGRGYQLKQVASGYRFQVRSEFGEWIGRLWDERPPRYTRALLETLALIAYKQPITRGDIEDIRGVAVSTNIIRTLLEREWIRVVGHRDVPGRPSIFATTKTFLDYFDLNSLDELPTLSEIKDLDKLNPELDLEQDLIEPRTLSLEPGSEEVDAAGTDDESLNEVTDRVNEIQQNIKNLYKEPEPEDDFDDQDELETASDATEGSDPAEGSESAEGSDDGVAGSDDEANDDTESDPDSPGRSN